MRRTSLGNSDEFSMKKELILRFNTRFICFLPLVPEFSGIWGVSPSVKSLDYSLWMILMNYLMDLAGFNDLQFLYEFEPIF